MLRNNNTSQSASPRIRVISTLFSPKPKVVSETTDHVSCCLPTVPDAAYLAHHDRRPNIFDDFFGAGALDAHHSLPRPPSTDPPPYTPYDHETKPDVYECENLTLARMLFYYGFLFFPFWLIGIWILFTPLRPTDDWAMGKTEDEKAQLLKALRVTEKRWAFRCLYAMLTLLTVVALIMVIVKIMH